MEKFHLLMPLCAAIVYAFSALYFKRALALGLGPWRGAFVMNMFFGIGFLPLLLIAEPIPSLWSLWPTLLSGLLLYLGGLFNTLSLTRGDVSLATPVMGFKPVIVAVLSVLLLGIGLSWQVWAACFLSAAGIILMQGGLKGVSTAALRHTVGYALASATVYALYDIVVQRYAPEVGRIAFYPYTCIVGALLSLSFIPKFSKPLVAIPKVAWKWIFLGATLMLVQSGLIYFDVAYFQDATGTNIVHSSRGVFSVIAVWAVGHHFDNREAADGGHHLMGKRLLGALLVTVAVIFAMTGG